MIKITNNKNKIRLKLANKNLNLNLNLFNWRIRSKTNKVKKSIKKTRILKNKKHKNLFQVYKDKLKDLILPEVLEAKIKLLEFIKQIKKIQIKTQIKIKIKMKTYKIKSKILFKAQIQLENKNKIRI